MDCAHVTKIPTPPSARRYSPPDKHALYKDNFASGNCEQVDTRLFSDGVFFNGVTNAIQQKLKCRSRYPELFKPFLAVSGP